MIVNYRRFLRDLRFGRTGTWDPRFTEEVKPSNKGTEEPRRSVVVPITFGEGLTK